MLLKKNRVPRKLFPAVLKAQKKYSSENLFVRVVSCEVSKRTSPLKVSFVVSKKYTKSAVQRNKLRRLGYNTVQRDIERLKENFLAVFFYTRNVNCVPKEDIQEEIYNLLKKADLYKI